MAVMNAQYKHPSSQYSQSLKDLIDAQLKVDPQQRPDIHQVSRCLMFQRQLILRCRPESGDRDDRQIITEAELESLCRRCFGSR